MFFAACVPLLSRKALTEGLGIPARLVLWGLVAASGGMALFAVGGMLVASKRPGRMTLSDAEISAPGSVLSMTLTVVPLADITSLDVQVVRKHRFLYIRHARGKLVSNEAFLPDRSAFERLSAALCERLAAQSPS